MIGLIFWVITLFFVHWTATIDYEHLDRKQYFTNHLSRWFQRFTFILPIAVYDVWYAISCGLLFAALFDHWLNIRRGMDFLHLGRTSRWDKFFRNHLYLYALAKCLFLIGASFFLLVGAEQIF